MKILIAEDDRATRVTLRDDLQEAGHQVTAASNGSEARAALEGQAFDCAILDIRMPDGNGVEIMKVIKKQSPETEVVLMTGHGTMATVLEALRAGAYDYLLKPLDNQHVTHLMRNLAELRELRMENVSLKRQIGQLELPHKIVGRSDPMIKIYDEIRTVAPTEATVLITGESGTGKELVAEAIHEQSDRKKGPLIKFSCAALPESLIEAELFGHEKGAFTGALTRKPGRFQMADGGSILLDDIDDVPLSVQAKLLRSLEQKEVWPVGGQPSIVDIRIIAATKVNLAKAAREGRFREDLYFRLNVVCIDLPPLRDRTDDIPLLLEHFLRVHGKGRSYEISPATIDEMGSHGWPGNVRELENAVERAIALSGGADARDTVRLSRENLMPSQSRSSASFSGTLANTVEEAEKQRILSTIGASGGRKAEAAKMLGISRKTLWEKMKKLDIDA